MSLADAGLTGELAPELDSLESLQVLNLSGANNLTAGGKCAPNVSSLSLPVSMLGPLGELCVTGGEFVSVSAGDLHTCGLKLDGSVACWGDISGGAATPPAGEFASVSTGYSYTCGVKLDGSVACWGALPRQYNQGQFTPPAGEFDSVSAGSIHACGVKRDGSVACWGNNGAGAATPPAGEFASVSAGFSALHSTSSIYAGNDSPHTCGVKVDGSVACWGYDNWGAATPPAGEFASVSAGAFYNCGVKRDGSVACWGSGFQY